MGIRDWLRQIFGGRNGAGENADSVPATDDHNGREIAFEKSHAQRDAYWASVGAVEKDVLGHLISPQLMGGPAWPTTRQAYRVVRRADTIIIATDGMSDPFNDPERDGNGFGMELFVETPDIAPEHAGKPGDISQLSRSWAFELVSNVASTVAGAGGILPQLERHGVLSMELPGVSQSYAIGVEVPAHYVTADDSLGILLGVPVTAFPVRLETMPLSPVTMVPITLITARELETLRQGGAEERNALAAKLAGSVQHRSQFRPAEA